MRHAFSSAVLFGLVLITLFGSADKSAIAETAGYRPWTTALNAPFLYYWFDAEYSEDTQKVYFLGGRLDAYTLDGSIWSFEPATGVYADTGVDMPVPVAGYQIGRMRDGGDEVFVIFAGDLNTCSSIVEGYKPASNTTVDYSVTDPYPACVTTPSVEVVNNKAYIFGGSDEQGPVAGAYIFDIDAAPGSRFTAAPSLNWGRVYIISGVVDGVIYAAGGDVFSGSLNATTIVEKLDTSNPTQWQPVAMMPVACDGAPGFGFDSGSVGPLSGTFVVAGCGQGPSEYAESMIYYPANGTWNQVFSDLNQARRMHAGAYISGQAGTTAGVPGMWVWGGYQGSIWLATPEHYDLTPTELDNGVPHPDSINGAYTQQAWDYYHVTLPSGSSNFAINLTGLTKDANLYVRAGAKPDASNWDCRPAFPGTADENCAIAPTPGDYWIAVNNIGTGTTSYLIEASWSAPTCLYCDDFEDGQLPAWDFLKPAWSEAGGSLIANPVRKALAVATPAFAGCLDCSVEAGMQSAGGIANKLWLFGWYADKNNTVELLMKEENNKFVLRQRYGGRVVAKTGVPYTINPNVSYQVRIAYTGSAVALYVNGVLQTTLKVAPGTVSTGTAGFAAKNTTGTFGYINVTN